MNARFAAGALALAALLAPPLPAQEEMLFEEASSGILELAGHRRLRVEGIPGTVFVRAGKAGELRYSAVTRTARKDPADVALWLRGSTIIFRPVDPESTDALILEVALSEGLDLEIVKRGGKVQVASIYGDVDVDAIEAEVDIRGAAESVAVRLEGGTLRLDNLTQQVDVSGTGVSTVQLNRLAGGVRLELSGGSVTAQTLGGLAEIDLTQTALNINGGGRIEGSATESRLVLQDVRTGGRLRLEESPLSLSRCRGPFEVETDAEFSFEAHGGDVNVVSFGAAVTGNGNTGSVRVENRGAAIHLSRIAGAVDLKGDGLRVTLETVEGLVTAALSGSTLEATGLKGGLDVGNDYGDVTVDGVEGATKIANANGSVTALQLSGSVQIEADGPEVRVGWANVGREENSRIENRGGDLYVDFPAGGGARIDAAAQAVDTDLPDIRVEDGSAHGLVGGVDEPNVELRAGGRIVLTRGGS